MEMKCEMYGYTLKNTGKVGNLSVRKSGTIIPQSKWKTFPKFTTDVDGLGKILTSKFPPELYQSDVIK